ncbi:orotidine-5'-phosphate decarboxylase [Nicoliella spurrieriana]|uniref:Orotidine 5'-phosphate decarboxylase n=1 Tax=Nicoliella spurrieriana TaxID=2925830 RepID=A0A976RSX5_9LACO|nr:orotidine-5'-phosphate decarboxylase [Nicoliella spurrieriana]UQS87221.1 orotidine-5'-phosphate decarboxylase [Nicoliella spurrieriana]
MKPIIIALDFENQKVCFDFLNRFAHPEGLFVKVGMELFYSAEPAIISKLRQMGINVFLDLKLYDIPHTVEQAMEQLGRLDIQMTTIHAAGGAEMIQAAKRGLIKGSQAIGGLPAKLLAVTQLTSTSESQMQSEQLVSASLKESVIHLARLAVDNGADGTISSALETPFIHDAVGNDFLCINPGIRLKNNHADDQKRITTPAQARELGSNGIVVGRAITKAVDPQAAYQIVKQEWEG